LTHITTTILAKYHKFDLYRVVILHPSHQLQQNYASIQCQIFIFSVCEEEIQNMFGQRGVVGEFSVSSPINDPFTPNPTSQALSSRVKSFSL